MRAEASDDSQRKGQNGNRMAREPRPVDVTVKTVAASKRLTADPNG